MGKKQKLEPFVMVTKSVMDSSAWRAMSMGARVLYFSLRRRYNSEFKNNGKIYLSGRAAAKEIRSHQDQVRRWFHELEFYGFIVQVRPGYLGIEGKGRAPHWRLTEVGYMNDPPTREFLNWRGTRFKENFPPRKSGAPRPGNPVHTLPRKSGAPRHQLPRKSGAYKRTNCPGNPVHN
jgi:hypothetical protein